MQIFQKLTESEQTCLIYRTGLFLVPFLEVQKEIMSKAPNKYWVILFRRAMVTVSSIIAKKINAKALVTGENVGQVASQTLSNINVISEIINGAEFMLIFAGLIRTMGLVRAAALKMKSVTVSINSCFLTSPTKVELAC